MGFFLVIERIAECFEKIGVVFEILLRIEFLQLI
jgi:hypothetical protein